MQTLDQWLFSIVKRSAKRQTAQQHGSELVFRLCWQIKFAAVFAVAGCGFLLFVILSTPPIDGVPWYLMAILVVIVTAIPISLLFLLPGHIVTNSVGISQRFWWRTEKRLAWVDLISVVRNEDKGDTIVYGRSASPIVFSPYLVDRSRFEQEVKTYSHPTDPMSDF